MRSSAAAATGFCRPSPRPSRWPRALRRSRGAVNCLVLNLLWRHRRNAVIHRQHEMQNQRRVRKTCLVSVAAIAARLRSLDQRQVLELAQSAERLSDLIDLWTERSPCSGREVGFAQTAIGGP